MDPSTLVKRPSSPGSTVVPFALVLEDYGPIVGPVGGTSSAVGIAVTYRLPSRFLLPLLLSLASCASQGELPPPNCDDNSCDEVAVPDSVECFLDGEPHPPETTVGPLTCTAEGTWTESFCYGADSLPHELDAGLCTCNFNGEPLSPGATVGPQTCTAEGTWEEFVCEGALGEPHAPSTGLCTCLYNGEPYPSKTTIGPFTCTLEGTWEDDICFDDDGNPHGEDHSDDC